MTATTLPTPLMTVHVSTYGGGYSIFYPGGSASGPLSLYDNDLDRAVMETVFPYRGDREQHEIVARSPQANAYYRYDIAQRVPETAPRREAAAPVVEPEPEVVDTEAKAPAGQAYYVTRRHGDGRLAPVAGPWRFLHHASAAVEAVRAQVTKRHPEAHFDGFGVSLMQPRTHAADSTEGDDMEHPLLFAIGEDVWWRGEPTEPYSMLLHLANPITEEQAEQLVSLVGYAWRMYVGGEPLDAHDLDSTGTILTIPADSTKSARSNLWDALLLFADELPEVVRDGSPVRKTDRQGPGTKGTRLVEGMGEVGFALYWDYVDGVA